MGLDQQIYKISKPTLDNRVYTLKEINDMEFRAVPASSFEAYPNVYAQLVPYAVKRDIRVEYYDIDNVVSHYNLPEDFYIESYDSEGFKFWRIDDNGEYVEQYIFDNNFAEKFITTEACSYYIWKEYEEYYWRKNYELQKWIRKVIDGVENTGYYILDANLISEINRRHNTHISEKDPGDESAMFYWEWY